MKANDQSFLPDVISDFVAQCQLNPIDTYMIDLSGFLREESVTGLDQEGVRQALTQWRNDHGDATSFLTSNPSSTAQVGDYAGLRFLYLFVRHAGEVGTDRPMVQVLVDFRGGTVRSSDGVWSVFLESDHVAQTVLSDTTRTRLTDLLAAHVPAWEQSQSGRVPEQWQDSGYSNWSLAVCADDYSVHRYEGPGSTRAPVDFPELVAALQDITGIAGLT